MNEDRSYTFRIRQAKLPVCEAHSKRLSSYGCRWHEYVSKDADHYCLHTFYESDLGMEGVHEKIPRCAVEYDIQDIEEQCEYQCERVNRSYQVANSVCVCSDNEPEKGE